MLVLLILDLALLPPRVSAQALTFDRALGLTEDAPDVVAGRNASAARQEGDSRISDVTELSRIYLMPGVRVWSEADRGFEGQMQLGHSFDLAGVAQAQRTVAAAERRSLAARTRATVLRRKLDAAYAWLVLRRTERAIEIAHEAVSLAHELVERITRAAERGALTRADQAEAEAFESETTILALAAEGARVDAQVALGAAAGVSDVETLATEGPLPEFDVPDPSRIERALREVERRPSVIAARIAALATRSRDAEARAERGPRLDVDLLAYRESPAGLMLFGQIGVAFPLADLAARERSRIAEESELREGEAEEASAAAMREAHLVAHDVEHCRRTIAAYRDRRLPALERLLEMRQRQLAVGEITVLFMLEAQRRLLAARGDLARAETDLAWAEARAWLLLEELEGSRP